MRPKNSPLLSWVVDILEKADPFTPLEIGKIYKHPESGRPLKVVGGSYWGTHGISNHFDWIYLDDETKGYGYGWDGAKTKLKVANRKTRKN